MTDSDSDNVNAATTSMTTSAAAIPSTSLNDPYNANATGVEEVETTPDFTLLDITDGENERKIPIAKFLEDIGAFCQTFSPPASAELLIGAYNELHTKYKTFEASLTQKYHNLQQKVPELDNSYRMVLTLQQKKQQQQEQIANNNRHRPSPVIVRYALTDSIYARAELDLGVTTETVAGDEGTGLGDDLTTTNTITSNHVGGTVNLWLGANVMLEYSLDDALAFLQQKRDQAARELQHCQTDLAFVRDQIVTAEVNMSRVYNWNVRRQRREQQQQQQQQEAASEEKGVEIPAVIAS